jgi:NADPH2:quinone reductase
MKAIRVHEFGGPEVLRLEDAPDLVPAADQVLVRIRAAGVNPVDAYIRTGTYARKPSLPYTPGSDGAGDVEAVGAEVRRIAVGDRVYIAGFGGYQAGVGTYAERAVCTPAQIYRLPERTSYGQGAAIGVPYATAYRALFQRAAARPGETRVGADG